MVNMSLQAIAHDAFRALVNLSDSSLLVASLTEQTFITFLVSYIVVRLTLRITHFNFSTDIA